MRDFINARLNKDNFWNLMFFVIFWIGLSFNVLLPQPFGILLGGIAFFKAISLVRKNSPLSFDQEKFEFTTSRGNKIQKIGVMFIWLLIISGILTGWTLSFWLKVNLRESLLGQLLFVFLFVLFPSLYCILRNFPISVYFKKEAWIGHYPDTYNFTNNKNSFDNFSKKNNNFTTSNKRHTTHKTTPSSPFNNSRYILTSYSHKNHSSNIYYKMYNRK